MSSLDSPHTGLGARTEALAVLHSVLSGKQFFEGAAESNVELDQRDRSFVHALVATALRHGGEIDFVLKQFLTKPLPHSAGKLRMMLKLGAAQLLFMGTPAHAAISQTVEMAKQDKNARHFAGLANAVLRRVAEEGPALLASVSDQHLNTPIWLWRELVKAYGAQTAEAISKAHLTEAAIDVSVKTDSEKWATALDGECLPSGSIRLHQKSPAIPLRTGFAEGAWWVQDAASALPIALLGNISGKSALDLCAAPGGKTAQLAAGGANVTAVDLSEPRLLRLSENLDRLKLTAKVVVEDVINLSSDQLYDIVVLDAPCSATGTLRRHPDLPYLKTTEHIGELVELQWTLIHKAASLVKPGGVLLYCTCSLLPAEGEKQVSAFLRKSPEFETLPFEASLIGNMAHVITDAGWLRTHPAMSIGQSTGLDGFFAARLQRA